MKLIVAIHVYWPVWIAITNQKSSKALSLSKYIARSIIMQSMPVSFGLPCIFHIATSYQTSGFYLFVYTIASYFMSCDQ